MRGRKTAPSRPLPMGEIVLLIIASLILFGILAGTAWAFASGRGKPGSGFSARTPETEQSLRDEAMFRDLGTLRAPTADKVPSVAALTPVFAYDPGDVAFREELAAKKNLLRGAIVNWFHGKTREELELLGDEGIKRELLAVINAHLDTGKASRLFFPDYLLID